MTKQFSDLNCDGETGRRGENHEARKKQNGQELACDWMCRVKEGGRGYRMTPMMFGSRNWMLLVLFLERRKKRRTKWQVWGLER